MYPSSFVPFIAADYFGDKRLSTKYSELTQRMSERQSVIVSQLSQDWAEQMSFYRFLRNPRVSETKISALLGQKCGSLSAGRSHVLCISDSSDFDYSSRRDQISAEEGLGFIGDHRGWGYNGHVSMVVDPEDCSILGLSDIYFWHRKDAKNDTKKDIYRKPLEGKESYRWISAAQRSKEVLKEAECVTFVQDREGDMYDSLIYLPDESHHLLIRSKFNRLIVTDEGEPDKLREYLQIQPMAGTYSLEVAADGHRRSAHTAIMELRYATVEIKCPCTYAYQLAYPRQRTMRAIYLKQQEGTVPEGEDPIEWYLLTTHEIHDFTDAITLTHWYILRWMIEDFFRLIKKKGFQLESAELETGYRLRKIGMITMDAAIRAMQLRQARDGQTTLPIEAVFNDSEQACLKIIGPTLEGKTEKQKNPYPEMGLPWASWIIARLGSWKGYSSQGPPGVITFKRGLDRFEAICLGMNLRL